MHAISTSGANQSVPSDDFPGPHALFGLTQWVKDLFMVNLMSIYICENAENDASDQDKLEVCVMAGSHCISLS